MVGLEQIPFLGSIGIRLVSYIRKRLSLMEKEDQLNKREDIIAKREKEADWLKEIHKDNKDRIKLLVDIKVDNVSLNLSIPRLEAYLYFVNSSIFDLTTSKIKYNVILFDNSFPVFKNKDCDDTDIKRQSRTQLIIVEDISPGAEKKIRESVRSGMVKLRFSFKYNLSSKEHNISVSSDEQSCDYSVPINI